MTAGTSIVKYLDKELIDAQTFHTLGYGTTTISIKYGQEQITVDFIVSETPSSEANLMWGQIVSVDRLQVHLVNLRQKLPPKMLGPTELGTMGGRPLIIIVTVTSTSVAQCKYISYSLYMGDMNG